MDVTMQYMNDETIEDLKQFISGTVSQQTSSLKDDLHDEISRLDKKLDALDTSLSAKIDDLAESVADALESTNQETAVQLKDHENRIKKLEQQTT